MDKIIVINYALLGKDTLTKSKRAWHGSTDSIQT